MDKGRVRSGLRLPNSLNERLVELATAKGVSKNALILEVLWKYAGSNEVVNENQKEVG